MHVQHMYILFNEFVTTSALPSLGEALLLQKQRKCDAKQKPLSQEYYVQ